MTATSVAARNLDIATGDKGVFGFGPFLLDPVRRRLTLEGEVVKLPPTQFDTLLYLVQNPGRVVEKDELLAAVWAGRIIEESNLSQAIYLLRRVLARVDGGDGYIVTAPGRGYRFSAEVGRILEPGAIPATKICSEPSSFEDDSNAAVQAPAITVPDQKRFRLSWLVALAMAVLACIVQGVALLHHAEPGMPEPSAAPDAAVFHPPAHSVAVLAFTNMSGDPTQEYFSDGLSEELINALSRTGAIQVAARMSAFTFKGSTATIGEIARKLNVGAVLEGSVRRQGTHLRVTAQLINAVTGYQFWSHSYDRDTSDVLALEADIGTAVARSLEVTLLADQEANFSVGGTTNPDAFDAYLRGSAEMRFYAEKNVRAADKAFQEAIRLDPGYADARAGHVFALTLIAATWTSSPQAASILAQALTEANKAVALAPSSARSHATRGDVLMWQGDLKGADAELSLAYALDPNDILVDRVYSRFESAIGHGDEAQAAAYRTIALDPLTSGEYRRLAWVLVLGRKYKEALAAFRHERALGAVDPERSAANEAMAYSGLGDWRAVQKDCSGNQQPYCLALLAIADGKLGQTASANTEFELFQSKNGSAPEPVINAEVYAQWGNAEAASRWLIAASKEVVGGVLDESKLELRTDLLLDPVRKTAEYKALERRMNFPP